MTAVASPAPLRLFVDGSILTEKVGGLRTFAKHLVQELARRPGLEITMATSDPSLQLEGVKMVVITDGVASPARRALWRETMLPRLVRRARADAVLIPFPELAFRSLGVPTLIVVHDVIPLVAPSMVSRGRWLRYRLTLPRVCRAPNLLVVSNSTLRTLKDHFDVDLDTCRVIGEGPGRLPSAEPPDGHGADRDPGYFLYVGPLMKHKNVFTLVAAVAELPAARLVISGRASDAERRTLDALCEHHGIADRVEHVGFTSDAELDALYRNAGAFVFPSLHEGFGLPVLEALQAGLVPIVADSSVTRGVAGDAAVYVNQPLYPSAWARSMATIASDAGLRAKLRARAADRLALFTWEGTATEVESAIRAAVARHEAAA